jgi:DNA gyrase inhibitor GyrI
MLKKLLIGLVVVIVIIAAVGAGWLSYMGYFAKVEVKEQMLGPLTFVYVPHKGSYATVGADMMNVSARLKTEFGIDTTKGMAIYYDDPSKMKEADLKSDVGCLLEGKDAAKADKVMTRMRVKIMYAKRYATASFPLKNKMSYMMAAMKLYPALSKHIAANGYRTMPAVEIYDMPAKEITAAFEIK